MPGLRVGVDLDGVVYDFVGALRSYIHRTTGRPLASMPPADSWEFWSKQWKLDKEEFLRFYRDGILDGFIFSEGAPFPQAVESARELVALGHELHIVTSRAIPGAEDEARAATVDWLRRIGFPYESLTIASDKASVPTDIFIDDSMENYDRLDKAGHFPWLYTQMWNASHPGRRVLSWGEFSGIVQTTSSERRRAPARL